MAAVVSSSEALPGPAEQDSENVAKRAGFTREGRHTDEDGTVVTVRVASSRVTFSGSLILIQ